MNQDSYTALKRSEMEFRALSEQTAVGVTKAETVTGRYVFVNQRFADIVGYTRDELLTMSFHTLTDPDDLAEDIDNLGRLVKGDLHEYAMEKRYRRKDGTAIWVSLTVSPLWLEGESPQYVIGVVEDITERKQAEDALRESERRLREAQEMAHLGFWNWNVKSGDVEWSEEVYRIFGLDPKEFAPHIDSILALSPWPEDNHRDRELIGRAIETHSPGFYEQKFLRPDKSIGHYYSTFQGNYDENGELLSIVGTVLDITERKQAEGALRESEERYRAMMDQAADAVFVHDETGRLQDVNRKACETLGYSREELLSKSIGDIDPDAIPTEKNKLWARVVAGEQFTFESRQMRKDGSILPVEVTLGSVRLPLGKAVLGLVRDITDRKRAEEEKAKLQAQLYQSQKVAAIGQLAGGVAHDFNNLLTGILGNIDLMRSGLLPADPLLENLNAAETAARRAADLTKGLLTFSRSAVVLAAPMSVTAALNASLALLKQSLPATIEIVRDYEQTLWNVLLDQSQMTQILLNLAANARDAMNGKGTLTVKARNEVVGEEYARDHLFARTGEFVHLSVTDTGPGISSEAMQHLFEPFYTTKPVGSGTGLGLSIVYGAVKQAGGWITAVSTEGTGKTAPHIGQTCSGATFDIYLPRCLEEPTQSAAPSPLSKDVCSGTILVVEDESVVCAVARTLLSRSGYTVLTASDGASAVNVLQDHPVGIGLILLDMTMPGMTTNEIIRAIRTLDPTVPILLNSGYTSNDSVKHMLEEGSVQGFLGKPYDLHELLERVQELLRRK